MLHSGNTIHCACISWSGSSEGGRWWVVNKGILGFKGIEKQAMPNKSGQRSPSAVCFLYVPWFPLTQNHVKGLLYHGLDTFLDEFSYFSLFHTCLPEAKFYSVFSPSHLVSPVSSHLFFWSISPGKVEWFLWELVAPIILKIQFIIHEGEVMIKHYAVYYFKGKY